MVQFVGTQADSYGNTIEADWIKDFEDYGCELNEVDKDAFVAASQPIWDDFRAAAGEDVSALIDKIEAAK